MKPVNWLLLFMIGALAVAPWFLGEDPPKQGPDIAYYLEQPTAMRLVEVMNLKRNEERRGIVRQALTAANISFKEEPFTSPTYQGANLIADVGQGRDILVFATHMDRVPEAPGANDNASCVAASIESLKAFSKQPAPENLTVRFLFSDGEEFGLQGARHHADVNDLTNYFGVASFEMCGIGDAYGVWDVVGPATKSSLVQALLMAGDNLGIYNGTHGAVPRFGSDHLAFSKKGKPAVGVTVLPQADEDKLRAYVEDPNNPKWLLNFVRPAIFRTYHTSGDGPETIDPAALDMTTRLMIETVRVVDQMVRQNG